jgi:hypothetical protein
MNTDFLGFGYFEWVEVLARLTPRSRTPLPEFHPASVQSGEFYSEEFGAVVYLFSDPRLTLKRQCSPDFSGEH